MGNTVGSYETLFWQKKWIPIKAKLSLSRDQRAVIIGSLLGDGTMRLGKRARNASFKVEHGLRQRNYVIWKYRYLKPFVFSGPKLSFRYRENGDSYPKSWWFRTVRHPILTEICRTFYRINGHAVGKKIVPDSIQEDLNPLALAVWIMDDGSYSRGVLDVSTYAFSLKEIRFLQSVFQSKFSIEAMYHTDRDKGYRMYFRKSETQRLIPIVAPYIIPSLRYKIGL